MLIAAWFFISWLLGSPSQAPPQPLDTKAQLDLLKLVFALVAGAAALVALVTAYRRQRVDEAAGERAERAQAHAEHDATERRVTELYGQAVEQLGHLKAAVRLGGLYSLERLAQDHHQHRQTVTDVVCAYLRMPFKLSDASNGTQTNPTSGDVQEELQVRQAAQRLLSRHLRAISKDEARTSAYWEGMRVDLTGAHLINLDFSEIRPAHVNFNHARFSGTARFDRAEFAGDAVFGGAQFDGATLFEETQFYKGAVFGGAKFSGVAVFSGTHFKGGGGFRRTQFNGYADFRDATFDGVAVFGRSNFNDKSTFRKSRFSATAVFDGAKFRRDADFRLTQFDRTAGFRSADFDRIARFDQARFGGHAEFRLVQFHKNAKFNEARFDFDAKFQGAHFGNFIGFQLAEFDGLATFDRAHFRGSAAFDESRFSDIATFNDTQFNGITRFKRTLFNKEPHFISAEAYPNTLNIWPAPWQLHEQTLRSEASKLYRYT
jgi:hypothetical protein